MQTTRQLDSDDLGEVPGAEEHTSERRIQVTKTPVREERIAEHTQQYRRFRKTTSKRSLGRFSAMVSLQDAVDQEVERTGFSGVVRVDSSGETELCTAYGYADRAHRVRNTVETLFATASGSKSLTALAVMSLVERGTLELGTTARSLLGTDLPLIADDVTIEQLLAHRSGIGDYLDEDAVDDIGDYVMPVSVHELATTEQFLPVLDGHETGSPPASGSPTTTAATSCSPCWPSGRAAWPSTSWFARWSASRGHGRHRVPALR